MSAAAAVKQPHRRAASTSVRAAAFSRDHHSSPSWSSSRKQLVEALTQGSALARAPCAWYVDKNNGDGINGGAAVRVERR
jgi:hypothetical protein